MRRALLAATFAAAFVAATSADAAVLTPIYSPSNMTNPAPINLGAFSSCSDGPPCTRTFGPVTAKLDSSNAEIHYDPKVNLYEPGSDDSAALSLSFATPVAGIGALVENFGINDETGQRNIAGIRVSLSDGPSFKVISPDNSPGPEFLGLLSSAADITRVDFFKLPPLETFEGINNVLVQLDPSFAGLIPEPASIAVLGVGLLGIMGVRGRRL